MSSMGWGHGMSEVFDRLLAAIQEREPGCWGIRTVRDYLSGIYRCWNDDACAALYQELATTESWAKALDEAARQLCYADEHTLVLDSKESERKLIPTPMAVLDFACVLTSTKRDRDYDTLESSGAELDERMPLLWQHVPFSPIGTMKRILRRNDREILVHFAIADTPLGRDAATLVEFGALRMSHGFRAWEAEPHPDGKGWHVKKFTIVEGSLVSIPSNPDGVITAFSRHKLHHPLIKAWARKAYDARPVVVTGAGLESKADDCCGSPTCLCQVKDDRAACVTSKIRQLLAEGKPRSQAVAMALRFCGKNKHEAETLARQMVAGLDCAGDFKDSMDAGPRCQEERTLLNDPPAVELWEDAWEATRHHLQLQLTTYLANKALLSCGDYVHLDSLLPGAALVCVIPATGGAIKGWKISWKREADQPVWDGEPTAVDIPDRMKQVSDQLKTFVEQRLRFLDVDRLAALLLVQIASAPLTAGKASLLVTALRAAEQQARERDHQAVLQAMFTHDG